MNPLTLVNGVPTEQVSARDRGFQYGDGLFETLAVCRGAPMLWNNHLRRLRTGADRLGIAVPDEAVLRTEADRLCGGVERGALKIIVTRGVSGRGYIADPAAPATRVLSLAPWPVYPAAHAEAGVDVRLCRLRLSTSPRLAGIKHLNRLEQVLARAEWHDEYAEGLMQDDTGNVIEGTMTNLFLFSGDALCTPDVSQCGVEGVMRGIVLERAARLGIPYRIERVTPEQLQRAEEVFVTNSLIGLWPVRRIDSWGYTIGETTRKIQQAIRDAHCAG